MTKIALLTVAVACLLSSPAIAWRASTNEDPFSDQKTAVIGEVSGTGMSLGAKCWENDPNETLIVIGTPAPYDRAAFYKDVVEAQLRVDDGEIRNIPVSPTDLVGRLSFQTAHGISDEVIPAIDEWGAAQRRIAISLENMVLTFPVRGSTAAVDRFFSTCGLDRP